MVTCEDFYEKFKNVGNFCQKSELTAKQIDHYIKYRERNKLDSYEINRCALSPLMAIEPNKEVHKKAIRELKKDCRKIGGRNITRRLMIEIINRANEKVNECDRLKSIPGYRSRMDGFQHEINSVSFDVRNSFDNLKSEIGIISNNDLMSMMINFCSSHKNEILEMKERMLESKQSEKSESDDGKDEIEVVKRT